MEKLEAYQGHIDDSISHIDGYGFAVKKEEQDSMSREDAQAVQELSDYVNNFIDNRFPNGLSGDIRQILSECIMDAFCDGARWQEKQAQEESRIILNG